MIIKPRNKFFSNLQALSSGEIMDVDKLPKLSAVMKNYYLAYLIKRKS